MPFLLLGIATVVFVVSRMTPADPLVSIVGERNLNNPEVVAAAEEQWGLNESVPAQYVAYMRNLLHGDMGTSFTTRQPVVDDLLERLPATLELTAVALAWECPSGSRSASSRRGTGTSSSTTSRASSR